MGAYAKAEAISEGLFEGSVVRVISNNGPITVEVNRNMISIGRRMAQKIRVVRI
jgi:FeoA domain.